MKIAISGAQNLGKTTLLNDIVKKWPMYETSKVSYRDVISEKNLPCNQETTTETQQIIMDYLCDDIMLTDKEHYILDRTPYDALVYSMWAYCKGIEGFDDEFMSKQILLAREAASQFDIIFFTPITKYDDIKLEEDGLRDVDPMFRKEIDTLFKEIVGSYHAQTGPYFKFDDCPAVIDIFGSTEERVEMVKCYLNESGNMYGEEDSLVADGIMTLDGKVHDE